MTCQFVTDRIELDIEQLRARYTEERDRRLRPDGENQYIEAGNNFASYSEVDPFTPRTERDPVEIDIEVAILGGGFSGLLAAGHLVSEGVTDFRIIDLAGDFGGTWYWNRYPDVQCDVDSYCYMPLLEQTGYVPKEKYAHGPEIYEHCQRIGRHFGLYPKALFSTMVRDLKWDEAIGRWRISTDRGDDIRTRFIVMASGPFNRPKLPGIRGISTFKGHTFHTARWDYNYTGGSPTNNVLDKLGDKKVAIIGTGSTGLQCVPPLAEAAKHLYVVQRTPASVDLRNNAPTDPDFVASLKPGWQRERQANFHQAAHYGVQPGQADLVCDGWTEIGTRVARRLENRETPVSADEIVAMREEENFQVMERNRRRVDDVVKDPETAEKLKAYYYFGCKRAAFSDKYLPIFNRSNVTLVDVSKSLGVDRITETGFVANGVEHEVDCIIFASGFEITTSIERRFGIGRIDGRDGLSLYDHWRDGFRTFHGMSSHGFPNLFFTGFIQGGVSANISQMYDRQTEHIAYLIREALQQGIKTLEPTEKAQDDWVADIRSTPHPMEAFLRQCTPGYFNNEGGGEGGATFRSFIGEVYPPGFDAFVKLLEEWRSKGTLEGFAKELYVKMPQGAGGPTKPPLPFPGQS